MQTNNFQQGDVLEITEPAGEVYLGMINEVYHNDLSGVGIVGLLDSESRPRFFYYTTNSKSGKLSLEGIAKYKFIVRGQSE